MSISGVESLKTIARLRIEANRNQFVQQVLNLVVEAPSLVCKVSIDLHRHRVSALHHLKASVVEAMPELLNDPVQVTMEVMGNEMDRQA